LIFGRLFVSLGRARRGELRGLFNGLNKNYIKEPDMRVFSLFIAIGLISGSASASAANFSFIGNLNQDDSVQEFNFEVEGVAREVTLRTWSFAGGTNAEGQVIKNGGFDPVVSLFNSSTGARVASTTIAASLWTPYRAPLGIHSWQRIFLLAITPPQ
jgi:hypothetical protein